MRRDRHGESPSVPQSFENYCRQVCALVRSSHDHPQITAELTAHMEDRRDAFLRAGFSEEEAQRRAVAAMGDPAEVGRAMDKAHTMGWEVLLMLCRTVLCLTLSPVFLAIIIAVFSLLAISFNSSGPEPEFYSQWNINQVIPVDEHVTLYLNEGTITGWHDGTFPCFRLDLAGYYLLDGKQVNFPSHSFDIFGHAYDDFGNTVFLHDSGDNIQRNASTVYLDFDNGVRSYHAEVPLDWGDIPDEN